MIWQRSVVAREKVRTIDARIVSNQVINSLQISVLKEVPSGNFNPGVNFLLKNISDDDVEVTIIPAGQKDSIKTILGVGWIQRYVKVL
jgi:hypothetical protein